jgi:hypothetical protein
MRSILILLAIYTLASPSLGQWDSRFFPTTNKPVRVMDGSNVVFASDVIVSQMVYAVDERWRIANAGVNWPPLDQLDVIFEEGKIVRLPEALLSSIKTAIVQVCSSYVNLVDGPFDDDNEIVFWSPASIIEHLQLPTNYWDYTPVRFLMADSNGWNGAYQAVNLLLTTVSDIAAWSTNKSSLGAGIMQVGFQDSYSNEDVLSMMCGAGYSCFKVEATNNQYFTSLIQAQDTLQIGGVDIGSDLWFYKALIQIADDATPVAVYPKGIEQSSVFLSLSNQATFFVNYTNRFIGLLGQPHIATNAQGADVSVLFTDTTLSGSALTYSPCALEWELVTGSGADSLFAEFCVEEASGGLAQSSSDLWRARIGAQAGVITMVKWDFDYK